MKDHEKEIIKTKTLIKSGVVTLGAGIVVTAEGLANQQGELGSVGAIVGATGVVLLLTAARRKKI